MVGLWRRLDHHFDHHDHDQHDQHIYIKERKRIKQVKLTMLMIAMTMMTDLVHLRYQPGKNEGPGECDDAWFKEISFDYGDAVGQ